MAVTFLALAGARENWPEAGIGAGDRAVLLCATLSAPLIILGVEAVLGTNLGRGRYVAAGVAPCAVVAGTWLSKIGLGGGRLLALGLATPFLLAGHLALSSLGPPAQGGYRAAAEKARAELRSGAEAMFALSDFVEGWRVTFPLQAPSDQGWLLARLSVYGPDLNATWLPRERGQIAAKDPGESIVSLVGRYERWTLFYWQPRSKWLDEILEKEFVLERRDESTGATLESWRRRR